MFEMTESANHQAVLAGPSPRATRRAHHKSSEEPLKVTRGQTPNRVTTMEFELEGTGLFPNQTITLAVLEVVGPGDTRSGYLIRGIVVDTTIWDLFLRELMWGSAIQ